MAAISWVDVEKGIHEFVWRTTGLAANKVIWSHEMGPRPPTSPYITLLVIAFNRAGRDWVVTRPNPTTIAAKTFTALDTTDELTTPTAHTLATGDGPVRLTTTGVLPDGLALLTDYWAIRVSDTVVQLAATFLEALAGTPVDVLDAGTGVHTLDDGAGFVKAGAEIKRVARGHRYVSLSIQSFADKMTGTSGAVQVLSDLVGGLPLFRDYLRLKGVGAAGFGGIVPVGGNKIGTALEPRATLEFQFHLKSEVETTGTFIERVEITDLNRGSSFVVSRG